MLRDKSSYVIIFLLVVSFFLHFWGLDYPNSIVFDEVYYGKWSKYYLSGNYFFDIHPPLGKLILTVGGELTGFTGANYTFGSIGEVFPDNSYYGLRFFPALFGSLFPLIIYLVIRSLGGSRKISILGMVLVIFENSMLAQSRIMHIDILTLFFGFLGLLFYLRARNSPTNRNRLVYLILTGLSIGTTISIKWNGLVFWFIVLLMGFVSLCKHLSIKSTKLKPIVLFIVCLVIIPMLVYMASFAIHFSLLPHSGEGDAFMTQKFQSTLVNNTNYKPEANVGFLEKLFELNKEMLSANNRITNPHSYSIKWYEMPAMWRSIYYWNKGDSISMARIYLIGNPFIWWLVLAAVAFFVVYIFLRIVKLEFDILEKQWLKIAILLAYLLNLFTYIFIGRVVFMYHYFPSLVFGIILLCLLFDSRLTNKKSRGRYVYWAIIGLAIFAFIYFSPLTYGWQLDENTYRLLTWLPSWV